MEENKKEEDSTKRDNNDGNLNNPVTPEPSKEKSNSEENKEDKKEKSDVGNEKKSNDEFFDMESESYFQKQTQFWTRSRKQNWVERPPSNQEQTQKQEQPDKQEQPNKQEQSQKQESSTGPFSLQAQIFAKGRTPIEMFMNPKLTTKDIHDTLWRCRDFELSHLWQRSIFLSAFLVLCFTGYGALMGKSVCSDECANSWSMLHGVALFLSFVGSFLSVLWIMMGKGSKAWYEKYEHAIAAFEKITDFVSDEKVAEIGGFACDRIKGKNFAGENVEFEKLPLNNCLFSPKGGEYSPSKINIGIGHVALVVWSIAIVIHTSILCCEIKENSGAFCFSVLFAIAIFAIYLVVTCWLPRYYKSSSLGDIRK